MISAKQAKIRCESKKWLNRALTIDVRTLIAVSHGADEWDARRSVTERYDTYGGAVVEGSP